MAEQMGIPPSRASWFSLHQFVKIYNHKPGNPRALPLGSRIATFRHGENINCRTNSGRSCSNTASGCIKYIYGIRRKAGEAGRIQALSQAGHRAVWKISLQDIPPDIPKPRRNPLPPGLSGNPLPQARSIDFLSGPRNNRWLLHSYGTCSRRRCAWSPNRIRDTEGCRPAAGRRSAPPPW